jgi:hypothetical protein
LHSLQLLCALLSTVRPCLFSSKLVVTKMQSAHLASSGASLQSRLHFDIAGAPPPERVLLGL